MLAADTAPAGWAHLVALVVGLLIAALGVGAHQWWMDGHPSPTPLWSRPKALAPGETYDTDTDDTDFDTADDTELEGRRIITLPDGSRVVRYVSYAADEELDEEDEDSETREETADRLVQLIEEERCRYSDAVSEIMNSFDVSESTAKRAIDEARKRARRS